MTKDEVAQFLGRICVITWRANIWTGDEAGRATAVGMKTSRHALVPMKIFMDDHGKEKVKVKWWGKERAEVLKYEPYEEYRELLNKRYPIVRTDNQVWDGTFSIKLIWIKEIVPL